MRYQYRAVVLCYEDPCSYCRHEARSESQYLVKDTYDEALEYGRKMANNVYGASTHVVEVEVREVTDWHPVQLDSTDTEVDHLTASQLREVDPDSLSEDLRAWHRYFTANPGIYASWGYSNGRPAPLQYRES